MKEPPPALKPVVKPPANFVPATPPPQILPRPSLVALHVRAALLAQK